MGDVTNLSKLTIDDHTGGTSGLTLGSTAVDATAEELNKLNGVSVNSTEMDYRGLFVDVPLSSSGQRYVVTPYAGDVGDAEAVINAAITTGDETLTFKDGDGNSIGTITLAESGSAAGDVFSIGTINSTHAAVTAGEAIEVETDGGNSVSTSATVTIRIDL